MNALITKFKEVLSAVLPITLLVFILHFTRLIPLETPVFWRFAIGSVLVIIGLAVFLLGVDMGVSPVGTLMGGKIAHSNKILIVIIAGLVLGFVISIAEPDLHILAGQVEDITAAAVSKFAIVVVVSLGVADACGWSFQGLIQYSLHFYLGAIYGIILLLGFFTHQDFLAIAFDASGATTGAMTVPFVLALALGVSSGKKKSKSSENDSFGLLGIASGGVIIAVMMMSVIGRFGKLNGELPPLDKVSNSILKPFFQHIPSVARDVLMALSPIVIIFIIFQFISFKVPKHAARRIVSGFIFTFLGLVIFLVGVHAGFMDVGSFIGSSLVSQGKLKMLVFVGFLLGLVTVLAEPAVYVLTRQLEDVTSGYVKRKLVLFTLSIGVATAVALAMLRIILPSLQLWHYLLPGYIIAVGLMFFAPELFIGVAYDSGGVASGPMTATFILAFSHGAASAFEGADVVSEGFGMIAMVAMAPIIAIQILGVVYKIKSKKAKGADNAD